MTFSPEVDAKLRDQLTETQQAMSTFAMPTGPKDDDGVPVTVAAHAEWRGQGRRLYLDGQPFPYGTHAPAVLDPVIEAQHSANDVTHRSEHGYHVLWVPIVVSGVVDTSGRADQTRGSSWDTEPISTTPPNWAG